MNVKTLLQTMERHNRILFRQLDGVTHEESLIQPPFRGNCLNWVLGHLLEARSEILEDLNAAPLWDQATRSLYVRNAPPIIGPDSPHLPLEQMRQDLQRSCEQITTAIHAIPSEKWGEAFDEHSTLFEQIEFILWHETYHVGQFEYLRQLTGKNDKVI